VLRTDDVKESMMNPQQVKELVRKRYDACAAQQTAAGCCAARNTGGEGFAHSHGMYSAQDLDDMPTASVTLSRGCGNPVAFADILPGETVVDLGCGAGIDVILAARRVGGTGRVIGVDMTPHMIEQARASVAEANVSAKVEFRLSDLERIDLPDAIADAVISNCVINLCPDKTAVFREAFRILRPGGRLAISDVVYTAPPPVEARQRLAAAWSGCLGGAEIEQRYFALVREAGFDGVEIVARHALAGDGLRGMACCPSPEIAGRPSADDLAAVEGKVTSIKFRALKPR